MNNYKFLEIQVGLTASFERVITKEMEDAFRDISGDENSLHKYDSFAKEISNGKFQRHVSFGMLTASLYSTLAGVYLPGENSLIHSFEELSFIKPVFVGDTLSVEGKIVDIFTGLNLIRIQAIIKNQDKKIVSRAKIKVLVMK